MSFIVAIDGPAGSGKGTITNLVGKKMNLINIDTGATFRSVTLAMLKQNIKINETEKIEKLLENIQIEFKNEGEEQKVILNSEDVTTQIREKPVNDFVSEVSTIKIVREKMLQLQRKIAEGKNVIMEGRDIGTTVFPNADVKIYLDATPEERAKRRVLQNQQKGINLTYEEVLENVKTRDKIDSERELSPLKQAEDAIYIDSTNMKIPEVVKKICKIIQKQKKEKNINNSSSSKKFDKSGDTWFRKLQRRIIWGTLKGLYKIVYRAKIEGTENIPEDGAFVLCGNHMDYIKVPAIVVFAPRKINFIAKSELFKNPFLKRLGELFDVIPVKRGKQDLDAMKKSLKVLNNEEGLGLFPEGTTRGLEKGVKVKNGAAFMALRTGKPIVPVGVEVTKRPFPKIIIRYGKILDYSQYQSKNPEKEVLDKVTEEMMTVIKDLANFDKYNKK